MNEWLLAVLGIGICCLGLVCLIRRDKRRRAVETEKVDELIESFSVAIDELKREVEVEWAVEQSKYEVKH